MAADLRPIRSEADYRAALSDVERLWGSRTGTPEGDRLDILATLIDAYEEQRYPVDQPDPIDAIRFRMEQQGLTRRDLQRLIGTRTHVSDILSRKRGLTLAMVRRLHEQLGIPAEVLIRPSRRKPAALPLHCAEGPALNLGAARLTSHLRSIQAPTFEANPATRKKARIHANGTAVGWISALPLGWWRSQYTKSSPEKYS
jgi:HTH-type transcriptional regulator/antitoxin HigA